MLPFQDIRMENHSAKIDIDNLDINPIIQFKYWLNEALKSNVQEPTAMVLSTASSEGKPSSRVVLLKALDQIGFTFFTNYESRKAKDITDNPVGSLLFYWSVLERQVRIEGKILKTAPHESDEYFITRPEGSKIGAWASPQSKRIPNREYLENLQKDYFRLFRSRTMERPENWGGYKLIPDVMEFWQSRENRLHDRFEYIRNGGIWEIYRLAP
jgi:pyridoxamine 5'-phosphate oxidase